MPPPVILQAPWRDPVAVLGAVADRPWTLGFLSGGEDAEWSYVLADPEAVLSLAGDDPRDPFEALRALAGPARETDQEGPPFQGGVAGLAAHELGDRVEPVGLQRLGSWPDLACARYTRLLAFDHRGRRVLALGADEADAGEALKWLAATLPDPDFPGTHLDPDDAHAYGAAVAGVVRRIRDGELFQANIARRWRGRLAPGARPVDLMAGLAAASPAPFASYLRLADRVVVSNSPERFLRVRPDKDGLLATTQPIKGTAPRGATPDADRRLAEGLLASGKDRAENLMIVDLMRNDLSRVCVAGEVRTPELFRVASFANVHHLVSTVTGRLSPGRDAVDLLRAAFPPGSITGAPKVQAMRVIAELEAPRGPFFGAMFQLGFDGGFDSSVLIRTAAFVEDEAGWAVEARAGAGIVADSDPAAERAETEAKISALLAALSRCSAGPPPPR